MQINPSAKQSSVCTKRTIRPITESNHLRNTKCRRTKNLVKKGLELSIQCELDIIMVVFDKKHNRYKEIYTNPDCTVNSISRIAALSGTQPKNSKNKLPKYKTVFANDIVTINKDDIVQDNVSMDGDDFLLDIDGISTIDPPEPITGNTLQMNIEERNATANFEDLLMAPPKLQKLDLGYLKKKPTTPKKAKVKKDTTKSLPIHPFGQTDQCQELVPASPPPKEPEFAEPEPVFKMQSNQHQDKNQHTPDVQIESLIASVMAKQHGTVAKMQETMESSPFPNHEQESSADKYYLQLRNRLQLPFMVNNGPPQQEAHQEVLSTPPQIKEQRQEFDFNEHDLMGAVSDLFSENEN